MERGESFDFQALKSKIEANYSNINSFAEKIPMSYVALNNKLDNKMEFTIKEIIKIVELLDIKPNEITYYFFTHIV